MGRLDDKVAIITGGAGGIGAAAARLFVAEGARVAIADINAERGEALVAELGPSTLFVECNHANRQDCTRAVSTVLGQWGHLHILFANAGGTGKATIETCSDEQFHEMIDSTLMGPWFMAKSCLEALKEAAGEDPEFGATMLFTGSRVSGIASPMNSPYIIAKHGVLGLARSLAVDLGGYNIRVNAICPGIVPTERVMKATPWGTPEEVIAKYMDRTPLRRVTQPSEIASAALFLVSSDARAVTGQALYVDDGMSAN